MNQRAKPDRSNGRRPKGRRRDFPLGKDARGNTGAAARGNPARRGKLARASSSISGVDPDPLLEAGVPYQLPGQSRAMAALMKEIDTAARADRVLVEGEPGTGKEGVADEIHRRSHRKNKVIVRCLDLGESMNPDSLLFGCVRGALHGAVTRLGYFGEAHEGTLVLDEIGDLTMQTQAKLFRVLDDGRCTPVGGNQPRTYDVSVVATTNRNIDAMIREGAFVDKLLYRLAGALVHVPPLSARRDDIPALVAHFAAKMCRTWGRPPVTVGPAALALLQGATYHQNVRELESLVARAVAQLPPSCNVVSTDLVRSVLAVRVFGGTDAASSSP